MVYHVHQDRLDCLNAVFDIASEFIRAIADMWFKVFDLL